MIELGQSIKSRLVSAMLIINASVLLFTGMLVYLSTRTSHVEARYNLLSAVAELKEHELHRWVEEQAAIVGFIAELPEVVRSLRVVLDESSAAESRTAAEAGLTAFFREVLEKRPDIGELFVLSDKGGRVMLSTDPSRPGAYHVSDGFFVKGREGLYIQEVYPSPVTFKPVITISFPAPGGVFCAHLNLQRIERILRERTGLGSTGAIYLVDAYSVPLDGERYQERFLRGAHSTAIDEALAGKSGKGSYVSHVGVPVVGVYRWVRQRGMALIVEMDETEVLAPLRNYKTILLGAVLAALLIVAGLSFKIADGISRPIRRLGDAAESLAMGNLETQADIISRDEVGRLAKTFNGMARRLAVLYDRISANESYFRALIENAEDLILILSGDGMILYASPSADRILGFEYSSLPGKRLEEILLPGESELLGEKLKTSDSAEFRISDAGGKVHRFVASISNLLEEPAVGGIVLNARDVTRQRELEGRLLQAQKMDAVGRLAAGIVHDFNNILAGINGSCMLLRDQFPGDAVSRHQVELILTGVKRGSSLTRQLLAFTRGQVLKPVAVDPHRLIREAEDIFRRLLGGSVELTLVLKDPGIGILADRLQLEQALLNLVTNARDAMPEGGEIRIGAESADGDEDRSRLPAALKSGRFVHIWVEDSGTGMSPHTQSRIFEPFFTTKGAAGLGLGLSSIYGFMSQSGGAVSFESRPGRGTTFHLYFPEAPLPRL